MRVQPQIRKREQLSAAISVRDCPRSLMFSDRSWLKMYETEREKMEEEVKMKWLTDER